MHLSLFIICLVSLAGYLLISGFHNASNAAAVPVRTRALTPQTALKISAVFNLVGVLIGGVVFARYAPSWLTLPANDLGMTMMLTALLAHIIWGLITWWLRMPSSSTHALLGGLLGSAWAAGAVGFGSISTFTASATSLILPLLLLPLGIFFLSYLLVFPLRNWVQLAYPRTVHRVSRNVMSLANSLISLVHGIQVGQKTLLIFLLLSAAAGLRTGSSISALAMLLAGLFLALGTMFGGWRIGYTFAHKMVQIDPFRGSVAQGSTALVMLLTQAGLNTAFSASHLTVASVLGAGLNQRFTSVHPGIAARLLLTWLATVPLSFAFSALLFLAISPLLA